jgi:hypothetical protein
MVNGFDLLHCARLTTHLHREYDSFAQRSAVRAALAGDKKWNDEYFSLVKPMWSSQSTFLMCAAPWFRLKQPCNTEVCVRFIFL